jgi:probable F420-dependent oxidoreductase
MEFGVICSSASAAEDGAHAVALARAAVANGLESVWAPEHVVMPVAIRSPYPFAPDGKRATTGRSEETPVADPLVWLGLVAGAVPEIRLGTGILILPEHNPVILAKAVASLDRLSGGRVTLGIGVGWLREEFELIGVPWARRGARTDEYIGALRALWRHEIASFHGEFVDFEGAKSYPKPAQPGGPPIVVGGQTEAAARRAGRLGDGFLPGGNLDAIPHLLQVARAAAESSDRDPAMLEMTYVLGRTTGDLGANVDRLLELGVHRVLFGLAETDTDRAVGIIGELGALRTARAG